MSVQQGVMPLLSPLARRLPLGVKACSQGRAIGVTRSKRSAASWSRRVGMSGVRLSVAMSVFNNARFLAPAIESILAQTFGDFEFLIVDDGSTDGSAEVIDRFAALDDRIVVTRQTNRGLIVSLNSMVASACAPLIARMDGDDVARPTRFERQIEFLDRHPQIGVVGTWTNSIDSQGVVRPDCDGHPTSHAAFLEALERGPLLCHPSVVMRTDVVRAVGGYHAAFRHCEDYDLWLRLSERTQLCSLRERLLDYRHSGDQVSSRHAVAQQVGAAVAWEAHRERMAGRPDPSEAWDVLPPIDALDGVFGRTGVARAVRARVAPGILYAPTALRGDGLDLILTSLRENGGGERRKDGLWRTAVRLLTLGEPRRAARLALALLQH